jgi:hypothetical protein
MTCKKRVLALAEVLSAVFVITNCTSALAASPRFYVRLVNPSNQALHSL